MFNKERSSMARFRTERERLKSFADWGFKHQSAKDLAAAGFYYTGIIDKVKCHECDIEVCRWEKQDVPLIEHKKWGYFRCNFLKFTSSVGYAYRDYERYEKRLETIQSSWRWDLKFGKQTRESLADAGFFCRDNNQHHYTCFCCGGRLKNIALLLEDPWYQHAKYHPECAYVQLVKGVDFVNNLQRGMKEATQASMERIAVEVISPEICILLPRVGEVANIVPRTTEAAMLVASSEGASLCKICLDKNIEIVFLPCRHAVTCSRCAGEITKCAICRININIKFKTFLS